MQVTVRTGTVIAGFRVRSMLGQGAMGVVYLADDVASGRPVALKVLIPELAQDERFRQRFLRESRTAATLDHAHIVKTVSAGDEQGVLYLAMAYVEGHDLRELLRGEGRLDPERAIGLAAQVAQALDVAHAAGLVHRDVKPANILIASTPTGEHAYVCDFGLARHTSSASSLTSDRGLIGTIDYIPPEQIEGGDIDGRADVYSLGCVLYECLAGARPFDRESELSVLFAHLNEAPSRISTRTPLPTAFDDVFAMALAKAPEDRFATCAELADAARTALQGKGIARRRPRRRRRTVLAVASTLGVGAVAAVGILAFHDEAAPRPPAIAQTSIAGARLGLRREAYEKLFGHGIIIRQAVQSDLGPGTGYPTLAFESAKVWVFFPDGIRGRGKIITTWNPDYKTAAGIGPCSTVAELKAAYGKRLRPDHWGTIGQKHFMYDVGRNLLFSAEGPPLRRPPLPSTFIPAIGIFDGSVPNADADNGPRAFAGFVTGNETPFCIP